MKIPKKKILVNKKQKIDIKKYISRPQPHQLCNRVLTNYNTLEYKSDLSSPLHTSIHNSSHILTQPKYTYLLTSSNDSLNIKTEPNDNNYYNKYLETFPLYSRNKNNIYSEKIKTYRKNLDEIVNRLNESNDKYRKIINKENIRLNNNNDYNENYFDEYYAQTPKYLTNNNRSKLLMNNFDTFTYNQRNKNNVLKNYGERTDIRQKSLMNNNDINNINKDNNDTFANIIKLRNEFNQISTNYLDVSQKIDSLTMKQNDNDDISYEEIIRNNSKLNDILNYNYKVNNDLENEKVFILMKLRLKNAEIIINKLEGENKKYLAKNNKYNNLAKINNKLEIENKNLKIQNEKLNININILKKEVEEYQNKFDDINIPKNDIQEKNIINNNEINNDKGKIIINNKDNKIKELKEKYKAIYKENKNLKLILQDIQSKYIILQNIHLELKQKISEDENKSILLLKKELNNLNKKCRIYEKRISELNKIENKYKEITKKQEENNIKNEKLSFCNLFKKYANDKLKENKLKMIIGIYLMKQNIKFNQNIKEYKDKNKKLVKSVRKLNDQLIEFKLKNLNNSDNKI